MLETMLDRHIMIVFMGILTAVGIMSKCIVNIALKRLLRAAGNMNKSNHPLMRLVRAKFEHVSMVSDKVENVRVFVDKYLYEYKVLGLRLHSWRRMEKASAGLCLLAGAAGAGIEYSVNGMNGAVWKNGAIGGGLAAFVFLVHLATDEKYQLEAVRNYMVDYLENICRHKYEKTSQKEIKILAQEGGTVADFTSMPAGDQANVREVYDAKGAAAAGDTYAVRSRERAGVHEQTREPYAVRNLEASGEVFRAGHKEQSKELYEARNQEAPGEALFGAGQQAPARELSEANRKSSEEASGEAYATRKREPAKGQSAVSAFLAAELKAEESEAGEASGAYQGAKTGTDKSAGAYQGAKTGTDKSAGAYRMTGLEAGEVASAFCVAEPGKNEENIVEIPKAEPVREALAAAVSDSAEYAGQARNSVQRQTAVKEKKQRKERTEEEADREIVIRRILEEFMA